MLAASTDSQPPSSVFDHAVKAELRRYQFYALFVHSTSQSLTAAGAPLATSPDEEEKQENEAEHIQRVKDSMREFLNLGETL